MESQQVGDIMHGKVTKLVSFGAFVQISDGIEGLVHISELAAHHVEKPEEVVQVGDDIEVKVIEIEPQRRRLSLSIKRLHEEEGEEGETGEEEAPQTDEETTAAEASPAVEATEEEQYVEASNLELSDEIFPDRPSDTLSMDIDEESSTEPMLTDAVELEDAVSEEDETIADAATEADAEDSTGATTEDAASDDAEK